MRHHHDGGQSSCISLEGVRKPAAQSPIAEAATADSIYFPNLIKEIPEQKYSSYVLNFSKIEMYISLEVGLPSLHAALISRITKSLLYESADQLVHKDILYLNNEEYIC